MRRRPNSYPTKYVPVIVTDWDELDAEIDAFIEGGALAGGTVKGYAAAWSEWEQHCERLGVEPLTAPYDAFTAYLAQRKNDGSPYASSTVLKRISAIAYHYDKRGAVAAYESPEHSADWKVLRRGLERTDQERRRKNGQPASGDERVVPLMRNELLMMLSAEPQSDAQQNAWLAAVLLSFDHELSAKALAALQPEDVTMSPTGVALDRVHLQCDHRQRIRGVPWDCTACAVRVVLEEHPGPGHPLLHRIVGKGQAVHFKGRVTLRIRQLRDTGWMGAAFSRPYDVGPNCVLTPSCNLTEWQLAGLRRACVLRVGPHQRGQLLRGKAWVSLAWAGGFRMCGDLVRLDRSHLRREVNGGWTLDLSNTKDDPFGSKAVTRSFAWLDDVPAEQQDLSVARFLTEYVCVRDAVQGQTGMLLRARPLSPREVDDPIARGAIISALDLAQLVEHTVLDGHRYTSKSCRKGFATQALEDGWSPEEVRDALRHNQLGTTLSHYVAKASAGKTANRLHQMVANSEDGR